MSTTPDKEWIERAIDEIYESHFERVFFREEIRDILRPLAQSSFDQGVERERERAELVADALEKLLEAYRQRPPLLYEDEQAEKALNTFRALIPDGRQIPPATSTQKKTDRLEASAQEWADIFVDHEWIGKKAHVKQSLAREFQAIHESAERWERERCAALVRARSEEYASDGEIWVLTQVADAILTPVPQ